MKKYILILAVGFMSSCSITKGSKDLVTDGHINTENVTKLNDAWESGEFDENITVLLSEITIAEGSKDLVSDGHINTEKVTKLYILNSGFGPSLYKAWESGKFGKNIAVLVDSTEFTTMYVRSTELDNKNFLTPSR